MARSKSCRDLRVEGRPDTLMPVRPSSEVRSESLSHDGETEVNQDQDVAMDSNTQTSGDSIPATARGDAADADGEDDADEEEEEEEEVEEARVAEGKKSPKDPTKKEKEEHELT